MKGLCLNGIWITPDASSNSGKGKRKSYREEGEKTAGHGWLKMGLCQRSKRRRQRKGIKKGSTESIGKTKTRRDIQQAQRVHEVRVLITKAVHKLTPKERGDEVMQREKTE